MNKNIQNILTLLPLILVLILRKFPKLVKCVVLLATMFSQFLIFFYIKEPNCYIKKCEEIELSFERKLYYEKYNTLDEDLNIIRSEHYQQSFIINAFNYQLAMFLIFFPFFHEKQYEKTVSKILYVILSIFSIEATLLLTTELIKLPIENFTYFEVFTLMRILETSIILIIRELSSLFQINYVDVLEKSISEAKSDVSSLRNMLQSLQIEPKNGIFSAKSMRIFISIFGIAQLFLF